VQYLDSEDGHRAGRVGLLSFAGGTESLLSSDEDGRVIIRPRRDRHFLELPPDPRR
jgi:hypothetical protein